MKMLIFHFREKPIQSCSYYRIFLSWWAWEAKAHTCVSLQSSYRQVNSRVCPVDWQLHGRVFVIGCSVLAGPRRRYRLACTEEPIGFKYFHEVISKALTVVHHSTEFFHLKSEPELKHKASGILVLTTDTHLLINCTCRSSISCWIGRNPTNMLIHRHSNSVQGHQICWI